jgi:hypothetical protein
MSVHPPVRPEGLPDGPPHLPQKQQEHEGGAQSRELPEAVGRS